MKTPRPPWRKSPPWKKGPPWKTGKKVRLKGTKLNMKNDICERCGKQVTTIHLDRHKMGKECQFRTAVEEQKLQGWHACSRQIIGILDEFEIPYRIKTYTGYRAPLDGGQMPVVWIESRLGVLCRGLKAKPLRWALHKLKTDIEFGAAMESVVIMEGALAAVQFAGSQWQNRKGVHKHKTVEARRAKT